MRKLLPCLTLAAVIAPAAWAETRTVSLVVSDSQGQPLEGLGLGDVALVENGSARELSRLVRDERPIDLLLLLDTSEELRSSLRLNLVEALEGFLKALPPGTRFALWKTGERPTRLLDLGENQGAASNALRRLFPQGGNTMLDALVEATREFRRVEGRRSVVLAVSGNSVEFSNRARQQVVEEARPNAETFYFVHIDEGHADAEMRAAYGHVFSDLSRSSGGLHETVLTSMGARKPLLTIAADLQNRYLLSYEAEPGAKSGKLEVQVARPNTRVRLLPQQEPGR